MKILAAEVQLRDETRELEQARIQLVVDEFSTKAMALSKTQSKLVEQAEDVLKLIHDLPNGEKDFFKEIGQISNASQAMRDATVTLAKPDTGSDAIAAETDAIEWLLRAKRSGGKGGGGGSPGSSDSNQAGGNSHPEGSGGSEALALIGDNATGSSASVEKGTTLSTGNTGATYPTEFQKGLDMYFEMLNKQKQ